MTQTTPSTSSSAAPSRPIFYTPQDQEGTKVALWLVTGRAAGAPQVEGLVGDSKVSCWLRSSATGGFLSVSGKDKGADGKSPNIATANCYAGNNGIPSMTLTLSDSKTRIAVRVSRDAPQDLLVAMGLDLAKLDEKKAAYAAGAGAAGAQPAAAEPQATVAAAVAAPVQAPKPAVAVSGFDDMDDDIPF